MLPHPVATFGSTAATLRSGGPAITARATITIIRRKRLQSWTGRVAEIEERAQDTYVFFNNHARGNAANNAQLFMEMLDEQYGSPAPLARPKSKPLPAQPGLFE